MEEWLKKKFKTDIVLNKNGQNNTVFSYENTKSLKDLAGCIRSVSPSQQRFGASFTLNGDTRIEEILDTIKLGTLRLWDNSFDVLKTAIGCGLSRGFTEPREIQFAV